MSEGDIKGAINIVVSKETVLSPSNETKMKLQEKHPPKHPLSTNLPLPTEGNPNFKVSKEKLVKAICSFRKGSAGGPDGQRPQHLIDMTGEVLGQDSERLLDSLLTLLNEIIFPGKIPPTICPIFFGANLMALAKPDGGVRPIAMGMTIRRLASKCIMNEVYSFCAQEFRPFQVGVGTPKGAEVAVHALRMFLNNDINKDKVLLKIDFCNAFNTICRDIIKPIVSQKIPNIYNSVYQNYSQQSSLYFGDNIIESSEGVQQGDPLGPFLFSLGINDRVKSMNTDFNC